MVAGGCQVPCVILHFVTHDVYRYTVLISCFQEVDVLEDLMKTVDGSKYSVHASSILESHDMLEPAAASSASASSKVKCLPCPHWVLRAAAALRMSAIAVTTPAIQHAV